MAQYVGALDQGTTSTRFMIFDHSGQVVGIDQKEHEQIFPKPGWVEHDPLEIWVNGQLAHAAGPRFNGFESTRIELPLREGRNEIVVRVSNYFGRNFNWAGVRLRPLAP